MTTTGDFPSSCSTNTCIFQDYRELAYIVCTVPVPPSNNHTIQPPSPENNLARLKATESQFRQASILAIMDIDTSQLFTFYKKVDVVKDQKALLAKFGQILRNNHCVIAYKAAANIADMVKPEHAKLYKLFVSALLASVKLVPDGCQKIIQLGQRYHLVERDPEDSYGSASSTTWSLIRIDLQIHQTGQVALTVVQNPELRAIRMSGSGPHLQRDAKVVLVPSGQTAIYQSTPNSKAHVPLSFDSKAPTGQHLSRLQKKVVSWLKSEGDIDPFSEGSPWVDLVLPTPVQIVEPTGASTSPRTKPEFEMAYQPFIWPAHLCFTRYLEINVDGMSASGDEDPLEFVQSWMETATERDAELRQQLLSDAIEDESNLFHDETAFDNMETFQPYGPPTFPTSQTVYPTPPDVIMTHATPAMSSIDGLAMTPATISRTTGDNQHAPQDVGMTGGVSLQVSAVGSGFYDEDLFEEVPEGTFDQEGSGPEPNWDFFDKPDSHLEPHRGSDSDGSRQYSQEDTRGQASDLSEPERTEPHGENHPSEGPDEHAVGFLSTSTGIKTRHGSSTLEVTENNVQVGDESGELARNTNSSQTPRRRRSSVYDAIESEEPENRHDTKYSRRGQFWFNANSHLYPSHEMPSLAGWTRREPSTPSESESDDTASEIINDHLAENPSRVRSSNVHSWHEYQPPAIVQEEKDVDVNDSSLEIETRKILSLLKIKNVRPVLEDVFALRRPAGSRTELTDDERMMVAQVFVEQYTQASLLHAGDAVEGTRGTGASEMGVSVDLNHSNAGYATVSQLMDIVPPSAGKHLCGKISRLEDNHISIKRSDKPLIATSTIIPFWDTLALQPASQPKDITAFCLHPSEPGYADSCRYFLERISDAYSSCGFGVHRSGELTELTSDGVISLTNDPVSRLRTIAETLADTPGLKGTAILYVIAKNAQPKSYCDSCEQFREIFDEYKAAFKSTSSSAKPLELVPQVIPASFLVSNDTIVVPVQRKYNELAFEVYGRIRPEVFTAPGICEYPLTLADTSSSVKFSLESQALLPASKNDSVLHVAYSISDDQRWWIATWTDVLGQKALVMTYQFKARTDMRGGTRDEIMKDMWEISHDMMKKQRNKWRLVVARSGFFAATELNGWIHLANANASTQKCDLNLVSIEVQPRLRLLSSQLHFKRAPYSASQHIGYGTPVSTPQGISIASPENVMPATPTPGGTSAPNAPTPPEHNFDTTIDGDLNLTDPLEECWAVTLPFGTTPSQNVFDVSTALASGYLVKRLGIRDEDGTTALGVHLIHAPASLLPTSQELFQEILEQYRGLATLAMARGCVDRARQVLPWHIHTCVTGAEALPTVL